MNNIFLVIKHEIITTLSKRSFWVMTVLFPIIILGLSISTQTVGTKAIEEAADAAVRAAPEAAKFPVYSNIALWFFIGAAVTLGLYFLIDWIRSRKK